MGRRKRSGTRTIAATPQQIFALLVDPGQHPILDGSGTVRARRGASHEQLELGSTFNMDMKLRKSYRIQNTVVEYRQDRLIAWRHFYGHRWRWELEPVDGGEKTEVTETFDWSTAKPPLALAMSLTSWPKRNQRAVIRTLDNLEAYFAGSSTRGDDVGL